MKSSIIENEEQDQGNQQTKKRTSERMNDKKHAAPQF